MVMEIEELTYQIPKEWRDNTKMFSLYPPIPKNTAAVNFDIYDFEMLFNDKVTNNLIRTGQTIGCFYIESPGMRSLLRKLDVHDFEMLTAASSIIRPGVAESGMMQEFIARHKDPTRRKYLVPEMEDVLGETYGVMIYQEDVIKVAHHVAGLTLEEADLLRRAMSGKMRSHSAMQKIVDKYFISCRGKGLTDKQAKELWRQIESFAGYSFCKAHSASFALLSYQVAFLKSHYPAEFMASVLSNGGGFYSAAVYVWECKRLGLKMLLPSINKSNYEYTGKKDEIQIGLMAIKNLSYNSCQKILDERKNNGEYHSLADFLVRTKLAFEETSILIKCGAMGCFRKTRPELLRLLDIYIHKRKILNESYSDLFLHETFVMEDEVKTNINFSVEEICKSEYESFGYMVTRHPLYFYNSFTEHHSIVKAKNLIKYRGKNVRLIGWYMTSKRIKTRKGDIMKFLSLEDRTGTFEAVIFPREYEKFAEQTMSMGPYIIDGKVDENDATNVVVSKLSILSVASVKVADQKDSVDNKYFGDTEKISEEDFMLLEGIDKEKLRLAYAS
jgi:DNA polymerase III alpha subunit